MKQNTFTVGSSLALVLAAALMTGCSATSGYIGHGIVTEVQLNQANYSVLRSVTGTSSADYILGIGPSEQDLMGQAKRNMLQKAQLTGSQAVINVTTDAQDTAFLIWWRKTVYVSAEVIEFR